MEVETTTTDMEEETTTPVDDNDRVHHRWVDYLPDQNPKGAVDKRVSLDVTETHLTEEEDSAMETENWPDSASLEDYGIPNALLVEHDPLLQHELLLTDPSIHAMVTEQFASSLQDMLEDRRRVLMASMEASQQTRRCLEPHIKQRASLASVLADIEGSSQSLRDHVLHHATGMNDMDLMPEEEEEMLASALDLAPDDVPPPPPSE